MKPGSAMRAAIYARVSSGKQRDKHTIESQLRVCPEFCNARGWPIVGTYVDDGRTAKAGYLDARTDFARLAADMAAGKIDVVVMVDQDRLTRSEDPAERGQIFGAFYKPGVRLAFAMSGQILNLRESEGDLLSSLQGFFAAEFSRKLSKRVRDARVTSIEHGRKPAGCTPFGYRWSREAGWSVYEPEAAIVRGIYKRLRDGDGTPTIALDLTARGALGGTRGQWNKSRVWRIATAAIYRGVWMADKVRKLSVKVPRIVDDGLWFAVHSKMTALGKRGLRRTKHVYLLEGIATCELCGSRMMIQSAQGTSRGKIVNPARYVCANRRRPTLRRGVPRCELPTIKVDDADTRVWMEIRKLVSGDMIEDVARARAARAPKSGDTSAKELAAAESQLKRLDSAEAAILLRFRRGSISEAVLDRELDAIKSDRADLVRLRDDAAQRHGATLRVTAGAVSLRDQIDAFRRQVDAATPDQRRTIVLTVIAAAASGSVVVGVKRININAHGIGHVLRAASCTQHEANAVSGLAFRLVA